MLQYGEGVAVLFSGLMFGLFHGNLNQFVYAFVLGLCFGFIYVKTGNIRYTIGLHMLVNFLGSVLGVAILKWLGDDFLSIASDPAGMMSYMTGNFGKLIVYFIYIFLLLGVAIAGIILFIVNLKKIRFLPGMNTIPKGKRFSTTVLNVGMALYMIVWIVIIIVQLLAIMEKSCQAGIPFYRLYSCDSFYYAIFTALSRSFSNFPRSAHPCAFKMLINSSPVMVSLS